MHNRSLWIIKMTRRSKSSLLQNTKRRGVYFTLVKCITYIHQQLLRYYVDPSQARISRVSSASPAPEQLSTARLDFKRLKLFKQSLNFLLSLFVCIIFQTCTSSRSSLASGSLIGSTLKARMEPSSQVLYSCLCSGTGFVATESCLVCGDQICTRTHTAVQHLAARLHPCFQG